MINAFEVMFSSLFIRFLSDFPQKFYYLFREIWAGIRELLSGFITQKKGISGIWKWPLFVIVYVLLIVISILYIIVFPISFLIKTVRSHQIWVASLRNDYIEPLDII